MGEVEKRDVVLEYLREKYPEDLSKDYNCYWWCTCDIDGSALTYYLLLKDKFMEEEYSACLRAHSSDPESLVMLLKMYLETCRY